MGALSSTMDIGHSASPLVTGMIITVAGFTAETPNKIELAISILVLSYINLSIPVFGSKRYDKYDEK